MKFLKFILIILSVQIAQTSAEGVVVLDGESGREVIQSSTVADDDHVVSSEATSVVTPSASTTVLPEDSETNIQGNQGNDGKLILNENPQLGTAPNKTETIKVEATKELSKTDEKKSVPVVDEAVATKVAEEIHISEKPLVEPGSNEEIYLRVLTSKTWVQVYFGYLDSGWNTVSNRLKNGSDVTGLRISKEFFDGWESGVALEFISERKNKSSLESMRVFHSKIFVDYTYSLTDNRRWGLIAGGALSFGDYRIKRVIAEAGRNITYENLGDGSLLGLTPSLGMRYRASKFFHLDGVFERPVFFGSTQKNIGGLSYLARFSLLW